MRVVVSGKKRKSRIAAKLLDQMSLCAWKARDNAFPYGETKVGASVLTPDGTIFCGCNIEHRFRCHDLHAEVSAISAMVVAGYTRLVALLVVADIENLTPCGGCLDWLVQFGGPACEVITQSSPSGPFNFYSISQLIPYHPFISGQRQPGSR